MPAAPLESDPPIVRTRGIAVTVIGSIASPMNRVQVSLNHGNNHEQEQHDHQNRQQIILYQENQGQRSYHACAGTSRRWSNVDRLSHPENTRSCRRSGSH